MTSEVSVLSIISRQGVWVLGHYMLKPSLSQLLAWRSLSLQHTKNHSRDKDHVGTRPKEMVTSHPVLPLLTVTWVLPPPTYSWRITKI